MSLYHEAAKILDATTQNASSIKSIVFGNKDWKSDPKTLFALSTEAAKWSRVLSEVVEKSSILKIEKQLTPTLALVLTHDLLLSRKGIALPKTHGLYKTVVQHKARLVAELTKARLRRGCASIDALREHVEQGAANESNGVNDESEFKRSLPRWIRINALQTTLEEQLSSTFAEYKRATTLQDVVTKASKDKRLYVDEHIPDLVAIPSLFNITKSTAYKEGKLILQDKASCFPAYLLSPVSTDGALFDACAAPGNKTTHLAALLSSTGAKPQINNLRHRIIACEKDHARSQTLRTMIQLAGADAWVAVKANQDFLRLDPNAAQFSNVTALLLDPSCSGSGIIGRDDNSLVIHLPSVNSTELKEPTGNKRKRVDNKSPPKFNVESDPVDTAVEETPVGLEGDESKLAARLTALSTFQLRLLKHAMSFPAAKRITYSTCSTYTQENEHVIVRALLSDIAKQRGWRVMRREDQVEGMRKWRRRGDRTVVNEILSDHNDVIADLDASEISDACIRCDKDSDDGTMGFFVAGFVRDVDSSRTNPVDGAEITEGGNAYDDEWNGFSDDGI